MKPKPAVKDSLTTHTPTPWKVKMYGDGNKWASFRGADGYAIGDTNVASRTPEEAEANAAFICLAVNCHEELVALLHESANLIAMLKPTGARYPLVKKIQSALTKAEVR